MSNINLTKSGILHSDLFLETNILLNNKTFWSYTPAADTNNSTTTGAKIDLSRFVGLNIPINIKIELDFTWGNFSSGTGNGGTFSLNFQGANYKIGATGAVWKGTNYIASALNSKKSCISNLNSSLTGGTYHYSTEIIIPVSWFATYEASNLGFRTNYSNGTGTINVSNIKIFAGSVGASKASFGNNYVLGECIYEY